jgi:hypothetical protein
LTDPLRHDRPAPPLTDPADAQTPLEPPEQELARRLAGDRPVPAADFRGALGRRLLADDPGYGPRPERLRTVATLYLAAGAGLMAVGVLQAAGAL